MTPVTSGSRFGAYEILSLVGAGGMGEVYRAHDSKLGRAVAIKLLPEAWALDADRLARFEREAKVLASLNHPHIAALYGFEEAAGRHLLVMEMVEGETLAERLARGPMPIDEALGVAQQIADALESAHEKGIVHRDLKPANVKVTPEDRVKVLDFGLARLPETDTAPLSNATNSPTLNMLATQAGVILGTAGYMSPEQAKGAVADHRSDVFSFGTVLYEMLAGRRAFQADTPAETMASVLMREPDFAALPSNLNPRISELLRRCLDKNPRRRWQAAGDLRAEIEAVRAAPQTTAVSPGLHPRPLWIRATTMAMAAILSAAVGGGLVWWALRPATRPQVVRFSIPLAEGQALANNLVRAVSISADGKRILYTDSQRLYLRDVSSAEATLVPTTEKSLIASPTLSPDGQSVVYASFPDRLLKRMAAGGGPAVTLASVEVPFSLSWDQNAILLTQPTGIMRIQTEGGTAETIVRLGAGEQADGARLLPDGKTLLFTLLKATGQQAWDNAEIVAQALDSGTRTTLVPGGGNARYLASGHLVYARGGILFAAPFDAARLEVTGTAIPVLEGVARSATGGANFEVSSTGSLVYVPGPATLSSTPVISELTVLDEHGGVEVLKLPPRVMASPRISPDGKRVVFEASDGQPSVWVYDLDQATAPRRLTFRGNNRHPLWSADGKYVVFQSDREGDLAIFRQVADVSGDTTERLTTAEKGTAHIPESWSKKDDLFLFSAVNGAEATLWSFSIGERTATRVGNIRSSSPLNAEFSPDGRWIAYTQRGGEATTVVYVEPFPTTNARSQVSSVTELGHHAQWSPDGRTLFYIQGAQPVVGVSVTQQPALVFGNPQVWPGKLPNNSPFGAPRNFDLFPDGKRFIAPRSETTGIAAGGGRAPQLHVVMNWPEEWMARMTAAR